MSETAWYRFLNNKERNSLSRHYPIHNGLIIRREKIEGNRYAFFRNHIDFNMKTKSLPKNFHEVIIGKQKPYFDFDKAPDKETLYRAIEEVSLVLLDMLPIKKENLLLFTSHGKEKLSAHLIVNGIYYSGPLQTREIFSRVCSRISKESVKILDSGVYSSVQCLRIYGNSKLGSSRIKRYEELVLRGERIKFPSNNPRTFYIEVLGASLVSNVSNCKKQPDLVTKKENVEDMGEIEEGNVKEIIRLCREKLSEFPFKKKGIKGNIILLERLKSSFCQVCNRIHENENPYIRVNAIDIYFSCRRGKSLYIGQLGEDSEEPL